MELYWKAIWPDQAKLRTRKPLNPTVILLRIIPEGTACLHEAGGTIRRILLLMTKNTGNSSNSHQPAVTYYIAPHDEKKKSQKYNTKQQKQSHWEGRVACGERSLGIHQESISGLCMDTRICWCSSCLHKTAWCLHTTQLHTFLYPVSHLHVTCNS